MRLALLAMFVPAVATAAPTPTETFVGKLNQLGCSTISKLAPVLGKYSYVPNKDSMANLQPLTYPLGDLGKLGITKVTVHNVFDIYHFDPKDDKDPQVGHIDFALDSKTDLSGALGALPGATHFASGTDTIWHAGALYFKKGLLTFECSGTPAWARRPWTAPDIKALTERVSAVLDHKTPTGMGPDPKEPSATISTDDLHELGIHKDWWYIHFKTPIPAGELLKKLGATRVTLRAFDSHMSHWQLHQADGSAIIYKNWRIDIDVVEDGLTKDNKSLAIDGTKLLITTINAHPK